MGCYDNANVFTGVVKIRKGLSCKLILLTQDLDGVHYTFFLFASAIAKKAQMAHKKHNDPSFKQTLGICQNICDITFVRYEKHRKKKILRVVTFCIVAPFFFSFFIYYLNKFLATTLTAVVVFFYLSK